MRLALIKKQYRDCRFRVYHRAMTALPIDLDRARKIPLAAQIYSAIREAIETGRLASGARLPSWRDLAVQLGVSRGTVRVAYARLINEQFAIGLGAAGTRVAERPSPSSTPDWSPEASPVPNLFHEFGKRRVSNTVRRVLSPAVPPRDRCCRASSRSPLPFRMLACCQIAQAAALAENASIRSMKCGSWKRS
jgi:DNA-binding transcriptional regulator YhcF (GntR family)